MQRLTLARFCDRNDSGESWRIIKILLKQVEFARLFEDSRLSDWKKFFTCRLPEDVQKKYIRTGSVDRLC
ncbi:hypothetical protein [Microcoleus sp. CAWBG24]|uniref:hypothetical protein n=1 Tax=Microcoleus sp. CAWBG24 TaxID=2841644 RepID=UPI0025E54F04|nr:hypothetical protein [Microcoleus sp. CAWBG24]